MDTTTFQVLKDVHTFYNEAFTQLVILTVAIVALVGGLVPFLIQWMQSRSFRVESSRILADVKQELVRMQKQLGDDILEILRKQIDTKFQNETKALKDASERYGNRALGGVFFVQAQFEFSQKLYSEATNSLCYAIENLVNSSDELNTRRALNFLNKDCMPKITQSDLSGASEFEKSVVDLTKLLEKHDENGRYTDDIRKLKNGLKNAQTRKATPPAQN